MTRAGAAADSTLGGGGGGIKSRCREMQFHLWLFSVQQPTVEVIFCYARWPQEDLWICGTGRGFMCHLEKLVPLRTQMSSNIKHCWCVFAGKKGGAGV